MFRKLTLRGHGGRVLWGDGTAARLPSWVVTRSDRHAWTLRGTCEAVDTYRIAQVPLVFTAPRAQAPVGWWCFPVVPQSIKVHGAAFTAALGPPEGGR